MATDPTSALPELARTCGTCGTCGGCGYITLPGWLEWAKRADEAEVAWKAEHPGGSWHQSPENRAVEDEEPEPEAMCGDCDGTGEQVTEAGRQLLGFLRVHGKG